MTSGRDPTSAPEGRLDRALVGLMSHDLRSPLGPLALAVSSIAEDGALPSEVRDLAQWAQAQIERESRLIQSAVLAARGASMGFEEVVDLSGILRDAAEKFSLHGGRCEVRAAVCMVRCNPRGLRDALIGLLEIAIGDDGIGAATVTSSDGYAQIRIEGTQTLVVASAFEAVLPNNAESAIVLGARAVFAAHGGAAEASEGDVIIRIPAVQS